MPPLTTIPELDLTDWKNGKRKVGRWLFLNGRTKMDLAGMWSDYVPVTLAGEPISYYLDEGRWRFHLPVTNTQVLVCVRVCLSKHQTASTADRQNIRQHSSHQTQKTPDRVCT